MAEKGFDVVDTETDPCLCYRVLPHGGNDWVDDTIIKSTW